MNDKLLRYDPDFWGEGKRFKRQLVTIECVECEERTHLGSFGAHGSSRLTGMRCGMPERIRNDEIVSADWQVDVFGPEMVIWLKERVRNRPHQLRKRDAEYWGISYADIFDYDKSLLGRDDLQKADQLELPNTEDPE